MGFEYKEYEEMEKVWYCSFLFLAATSSTRVSSFFLIVLLFSFFLVSVHDAKGPAPIEFGLL